MNNPKESGRGAWDNFPGTTLFSSSLPVLSHLKLNLSEKGDSFRSIDDASSGFTKPHQDDEENLALEDVETHSIGCLLPDDEEELLAGINIMDDFDLSGLPGSLEDLEDDLFSSGGGMELESDPQHILNMGVTRLNLSEGIFGNMMPRVAPPNGVVAVAGEHPYGEHPSRTLFVRNINSNVEDAELKTLFEQYGDIRTLYSACKHRGFVMISYYDIRSARTAMRALQNKPLRRRKLDIHFSIPKDNPSDKDMNQGTLVIFNLDPSVSNEDLRQIFGAYGEVKEIRETPQKRHHKFIEFYDVRAAEAALKALNRMDIAGKRIKLEPSRPGGVRRNMMLQMNQDHELDDTRSLCHHVGSPVTNSPPGYWFNSPIEHGPIQSMGKSPVLSTLSPTASNHMPGLASILHPQLSNSLKIAPSGKDHGKGSFDSVNMANFQQSHSVPVEPKLTQYHGTMSSFGNPTSSGSSVETLSGAQFLWGSPNPYPESNSSSTCSRPSVGHPLTSNGKGHAFPYSGRHTSFFCSSQPHHHHVGSAPSGVPFESQFGSFLESSNTSRMGHISYGAIGFGSNDGNNFMLNTGINVPSKMSENGSSNYRTMSPRLSPLFLGTGLYLGPLLNNMDGFNDRGRSKRVENNSNQIDSKKQFQLDLEKIKSGEDTRTTLMMKNIPNKYTSKMLLSAIDENHKGTYDFLYLPIDFKNKCNVGYAFINMLSPSYITAFYEAFNGKKWEKFNSEKVASLAYARIQGKAALVTHFQNSSLMNEDKRCRPIIFHSEGQESSDQITLDDFASSSLNIQIRDWNGSYSSDSLGSPAESGSREKPEES